MNDILSSKQLNDEQKAKLYNQVLQRYLTYYDQRKNQPLHVKLTTPKPVETLKPEESEETSEGSTTEAETIPTSAVEQEVMKSVPKFYKAGARQLLDKIKENRDVLNWNEKGELMYENKPITGSHVVDLVNDMLPHRKGFEPVGWSVFVRGLARMNVPENLVRNPQRQSAIREFKTRVRDETPDSPSRWIPTPPSTSSPLKKQKRRIESPRPQVACWLRLQLDHDKRHLFFSIVILFFILIFEYNSFKLNYMIYLLNLVLCVCPLNVYMGMISFET